MRRLHALYALECRLFNGINRYFNRKLPNFLLRNITHVGGASFLIATVIILMIVLPGQSKIVAISSALALTVSHIPVHLVKKTYPRKRPYMVLKDAQYPFNPLQDHSFPSGHTTAIFSVVIPFILYAPILACLLLPLAFLVGMSRIYLGLHYPSDVIAGGILGSLCGSLCYYLPEIWIRSIQ